MLCALAEEMDENGRVKLFKEPELDRWRRAFLGEGWLGTFGHWLAARRLRTRLDRADVVSVLVEGTASSRSRVRDRASELLRALRAPAAIEAACEAATAAPRSPVATICIEERFEPRDDERASLFLFVTGQLDRYFELDEDFRFLRPAFDRANATLRRDLLRVLRSGDRRCLDFFTARKALAECSGVEVESALRSYWKHKDGARLFRACLEVPLRYGLPYLQRLARANWEPDEPEARSAFAKIARDLEGLIAPSPRAESAASATFSAWIAEGRERSRSAATSIEELLAALGDAAEPRTRVAIVAEIAERAELGSLAAKRVAEHPDWMVRLAGETTGLTLRADVDESPDEIYWVRRLAPEYPVLQIAPAKATPALLDSLEETRPELWTGPLGVARRVLQTLMAYRVTTGSFDEVAVDVGAYDGEFEPIEDGSER